MSFYSISHLPSEDRPRERLAREGAESLSSAELIAIILGSGSKTKPILQLAHEIISRFGCLQNLSEATLAELRDIKGVGFAKAIQIKAAISLGIRASRQSITAKYRIEHPQHGYHLLKESMEKENREIFMAILLDAKGYVISQEIISIGTLTETLVHPRELFYLAIRHKAVSLIIAHNHPSGDPTPSAQDIALTKTLIEAGKLMNIPLNDHLIIGHHSFTSLRQQCKIEWF
ncbi:MAG: DNA repair protein RadC [Parachlamydiaceae bacterium]|nr:DNA repair protein RadC [Parachlamydiaceae bacterium]